MVNYLERVIVQLDVAPSGADQSHPMRQVTRQVAFEPEGWTAERRAKVADLFNSLAPEWDERIKPGRHDALRDALARGLSSTEDAEVCLEIGSGTGDSTPFLQERFSRVLSLDLAHEMLARASSGVLVQADSAGLPLPEDCGDAVVLVNALLFPSEVERVLRPKGRLIWVNTSGSQTPIHLSAEDVVAALPGNWSAVASEAGNGTWCVATKSNVPFV